MVNNINIIIKINIRTLKVRLTTSVILSDTKTKVISKQRPLILDEVKHVVNEAVKC